MRTETGLGAAASRVSVWDSFVRIFHWSLAASVSWAAISGLLLAPTWLRSHLIAGTATAALVGVRVCWGLLGPTYARFGSFLTGRRAILRHLDLLWQRRDERYVGHNPLGGLMVLALLLAVVALALTGTVTLGGSLKTGPLAFLTSFTVGENARKLHELFAYLLLGLIVFHIFGVVFESWRSRENLVSAMVDGKKALRPGDHEAAPQRGQPALAVALAVFGLALSSLLVLAFSSIPGPGTPVKFLDPLYVVECGACHMPFHPSLAPAFVWSAIVDRLGDHFGEDASLDSASADRIRSFLLANSADVVDTRPANRLRVIDRADPLRITATPFWKHVHAGISDAVFKSKPVGSRAACGACHQDAATGFFYPAVINIPQAPK